ncbi:MAG: sigma-54 dependent transcriptional regulator [Myxococcota bacterium]|jgi:two-component system response regulator PilR (NtrC family)
MGRILVVDDERAMRQMLSILLRQSGHEVVECGDGIEAFNRIKDGGYDLVITDLRLPGADGLEVLKVARRFMPVAQVILITAYATTENAIEAMKLGAYDYILKPFKVEEMKILTEKALEKCRLVSENMRLRESLMQQYRLENIVGKSRAIRDIFELVRKVAVTKASVLVLGESGTGKELVARAVHGKSQRSDKPFVVVNCSAIPETLMESELFGYKKGSFTGANADKKGLLEVADGGTLFLDEIADVPLAIQVKLLRVLQDKTFRPVGGLSDVTVDVRVIAATNRNIEQDMASGRFREDLYYRLRVIQIDIPPLRKRSEDIPLIAEHFLRKYASEQGKDIPGYSTEAMAMLTGFSYRGNVRQLSNIVERAVTLTESGGWIEVKAVIGQDVVSAPGRVDFDAEVAEFEKKLIRDALVRTRGDRQAAADLLKLSMRSLRYRLDKYEIDMG